MAGRLRPAAARAHIASGELEPIYVVVGDDETEKTALVAAFGEVIDPGLRAFNVDRLYGAETSVAAFLDAVRTLPLMVPRRIIVVLDAGQLLSPRRERATAEQDAENLAAFVRTPESHATVVFVADALDGRRTVTKLLYKHAVVIECGGLNDAADAEQWVRARVAEQSMKIEPAAARLLVERAGLNVPRLRGEVERACLYAAGQPAITVADVRAVSGALTSQDDWAMVEAMKRGAAAEALRELSLLLDSGAQPLPILGQLRYFAERFVGGARQGKAFDALLRTDLALKTSAGDPQILLERLVVELCEGIR